MQLKTPPNKCEYHVHSRTLFEFGVIWQMLLGIITTTDLSFTRRIGCYNVPFQKLAERFSCRARHITRLLYINTMISQGQAIPGLCHYCTPPSPPAPARFSVHLLAYNGIKPQCGNRYTRQGHLPYSTSYCYFHCKRCIASPPTKHCLQYSAVQQSPQIPFPSDFAPSPTVVPNRYH